MAFAQLPTFQAEGRFVVARPFTFNGKELCAGDSIAGIPARRLRQLFDRRRIVYAESKTAGAAGKGKS